MNQNKPHYVDINKITLRLPAYKDDDEEAYVPVSDVRRILTEAREADVQEVKHAKWEMVGHYKVKCTNCHRIRDVKTQCGWNFCPDCGAKMDWKD